MWCMHAFICFSLIYCLMPRDNLWLVDKNQIVKQKMFHSKTEPFEDNENEYNASFLDHPTLVNLHSTEIALAKAMENISELQDNLSFMIEYNSKLKQENARLRANQQKSVTLANSQIAKKQRELAFVKQENENIADLLEEAKNSLICTEEDLANCKEQIARKQRAIRELKKAYEELENNIMNQSATYLNIGDSSSLCGKDSEYICELEKRNNELEIIAKRFQQQAEKSELRSSKLEKDIGEYKKWMASLIGMPKIVEGSEKIVMKEISQRMIAV